MKWRNIAIATALTCYAHGCGAAVLFRNEENNLGGWALAVCIVTAMAEFLFLLLAHEQAENGLLRERDRLYEENRELRLKLVEREASDPLP